MNFTDTKVLGIDFHSQDVYTAIDRLRKGGLLVVPAAPGLVTIMGDKYYYNALKASDVAIPDSGYMVLLWNLLHRPKLARISGLKFIVAFLADEKVKQESVYLVNPTPKHEDANITYLRQRGFEKVGYQLSYNAPMYPKGEALIDQVLLADIEEKKPAYILINLGGGIQEKIGAYLKAHLSYKPTIICTGAAIAFMTGQQTRIPMWADRLFLGWLMRCLDNPKQYIPRYQAAFKLISLMLKLGPNGPGEKAISS
ncbi:MAG: WecB/TagA/CpsF family glycosyltransferase [Bacteroidota bacterium]